MAKQTLMAIDAGTGSVRAVLFNTDGSVNTEAVEQLLASAPDDADLDQFATYEVTVASSVEDVNGNALGTAGIVRVG